MEVKTIFLITITLVFIVVSLSLIVTMSGVSKNLPSFLRDLTEGIYSLIFRSPYNICEAYQNKRVSYEEFKTLLVAIKEGACKNVSATVRLTFSLSKNDIKKLPKEIGISKEELVFFGRDEPLGVGGIIVKGNPGEYPVKLDDKVEIFAKGSPEQDLIIVVKEKGCDPFDDVCDIACSYKRGVCDPLCYRNGKKEDVVCDIDCVDKNKNGRIDSDDYDGICDLDCYNNFKNPQKAYDPDCALLKVNNPSLASSYGLNGICDPDSHGINDGICDPDCAKDNFICDPDCDGVTSSSNPQGLKDNDCYTCDKTCNGFCSKACSASDKDPDCPYGFIDWETLEECCGNGICGKDEDCESCSKDCPLGNTCEDFGKVCCPKASDRDDYGCSAKKNLSEGEECGCDSQCNATLKCDKTKHCCPPGKQWNGTQCIKVDVWDLVIVALNFNENEEELFNNVAKKAYEYWLKTSPFKECKNLENRIKVYYVGPKYCRKSCTNYCEDCVDAAIECTRKYFKDVFDDPDGWDKIAAFSKKLFGSVLGCGPWIPGPGGPSSTSYYEIYRGATNTFYPERVFVHEVGHTLNLCHECNLARPESHLCPNRNLYDIRYMMCYGTMEYFSEDSYKYLKGDKNLIIGGKNWPSQISKYVRDC